MQMQWLKKTKKSIDLDADMLMQLSKAHQRLLLNIWRQIQTRLLTNSVALVRQLYFVDGDMFYGQDNLCLVERALSKPFA